MEAVRAAGRFREVRTGYIDEEPYLEDAARLNGPALCLPFFAMRAGHVEVDIPQALSNAGFCGHLLDPIGLHPAIPQIVAAARCAPAGSRIKDTVRANHVSRWFDTPATVPGRAE